MNLEEMQARLKKTEINQDQAEALAPLYILLDLHKDDFCKIIDAVGMETLLKKKKYYDRLLQAEVELSMKERYLQAKARLEELEMEKESLDKIVNEYKPIK